MGDGLPTDYDVILVGTGMTESIVAAAVSRIGKQVLHLDSNEFYGGMWASFNFDALQKWLAECRMEHPEDAVNEKEGVEFLTENETLVKMGNRHSTIYNIEEEWHVPEVEFVRPEGFMSTKNTQTEVQQEGTEADDLHSCIGKGEGDIEVEVPGQDTALDSKQWSRKKIADNYRKFNLDLAPKLLYARGSMVELLISSNIGRYAEFRSVSRILTWFGTQLEPVPCSRTDLFSSRSVSILEKRMLGKLLSLCLEYSPESEIFKDYEQLTFGEFLQSQKLTPHLEHYILSAIATCDKQTGCLEGIQRTKRFLDSLGRYGNTPFLWPMYGSGELPQCFCRLCAVFGGVYHLKRSVESMLVGCEGQAEAIVSGGQRLNTKHLVLGVATAPQSYLAHTHNDGISRAIFITDRSILCSEKESLTLLHFPLVKGCTSGLVTVIEVGPSTSACPHGLYIVHMSCRQNSMAREDLAGAVDKLLCKEHVDGVSSPHIQMETQSTQTKKQGGGSAGQEESWKDKSVAESPKDKLSESPATKPQVLWSLYFNVPYTTNWQLASSSVPSNVHIASGPDLDLDFEFAVQQAKEIFSRMFPDCEFLPRSPDPEEIVLEDDEPADCKSEALGSSEENIIECGADFESVDLTPTEKFGEGLEELVLECESPAKEE